MFMWLRLLKTVEIFKSFTLFVCHTIMTSNTLYVATLALGL
jgi:hypothetical protein